MLMIEDYEAVEVPNQTKRALNRAKWRAEGRYEAIEALAAKPMSLEQLQAAIRELEDRLTDPTRVWGSMQMNMSPRLYREGYWAGLKEILCIMLGGQPSGEPDYPTPPVMPSKE